MRGSGKPKLSDSRFSSAKPAASLKAQVAKRPANQAADEFEAHTPIKPGNLQEAEAICNTLMTTETKDRAISLNLASIDLRKRCTARAFGIHSKPSTPTQPPNPQWNPALTLPPKSEDKNRQKISK
jgi:predicted Zn-dependent protease